MRELPFLILLTLCLSYLQACMLPAMRGDDYRDASVQNRSIDKQKDFVFHRKLAQHYNDQYQLTRKKQLRTLAIEAYEQLIHLDPQHMPSKLSLYSLLAQAAIVDLDGQAWRRLESLFAHTPAFRQAAVLPPAMVKVYMMKKSTLPERSFADLKSVLKRAIKESPQHPEAKGLLANLYAVEQRYALSNFLLQQVLYLDRNDLEASQRMANNFMEQIERMSCKAEDRHTLFAAIKAYKTVLKIEPENRLAHADLAWLYKLAGKNELFLFEATRALELYESQENRLNHANALLWNGRWQEAHMRYQQILLKRPNTAGILKELYMLYFLKENWSKANQVWEQYQKNESEFYFYGYLRQMLTLSKIADIQSAQSFMIQQLSNRQLPTFQRGLYQYMVNEIDQGSLLSLARNSCEQTEAYYYIGLKARIEGNQAGALEQNQKVISLRVYSFNEYISAQYALQRY